MSRRESLLFALALVAFVSLGLPDAVLGVAWPSMRRSFDLPLDRLGVLLLAASVGYIAISFLNGPLTRRFGVGGVLVGSSALVVLSAVAFAAAPRFALLLVAALFAGTGGGAIDAAINGFAARHFSAGRVAWLHASYGVGAALGPMLMTAVLTAGLSWRWGYTALGALIAVLSLGFARTRDLWQVASTSGVEVPDASLRASLRRPVLHGSALIFFVYTGVEAMAGQWAFSLFTEGRAMAASLAGIAVSLYWGGLTLGRVASGVATHHVSPRCILRGSLVLAPAWAGIMAADLSPWADLASLAALGFTVGPVFPLLIAETPGRLGAAHSANAVGVQIAAGSLGWAALPAGAGVLAEWYGLETIPYSLMASSLAVLALYEALARRPVKIHDSREVSMPIRPAVVLVVATLSAPAFAAPPIRTRELVPVKGVQRMSALIVSSGFRSGGT